MRKHHVRPEKPESASETVSAMIKRTKAKIQNSRFANKYSILGVSLLFAGIGGYFIINSFAATGENIPACTTTVSSTSAAQTALNSASGGAVVCLSNGTYGKLTLSATKTSPGVTVRAQNPGNATIDGASLSGAWFTLAQFNVTDEVKVENNAHHITILHNSISGGYMGITAGPGTYNYQRVKDITIRGNKIVGPLGEDGIRANQYGDGDGDGNGLLVEGNEFTGIRENGNHSDCLQTVWVGDHLVYRYNYLHDNRCQGFFVKDQGSLSTAYGDIGPIDSIKVENNLFTRNNEPCDAADPNCGQPSYFQVISPVNNLVMDKNTIWGGDVLTTLRNMDSNSAAPDNQWGTISVTNNVLNRIWSDYPSIFGSNYSASNNIRGDTYNNAWPTTGFTTNNNPGFPAPTLAGGDDFRLNNGKGVTWKPSDCIFGPSATLATNCPWETSQVQVPPTSSTANLWVAPGGTSNCVRSATPTAYASGGSNVCDSINSAWGKCLSASNDKVVIKPFTGGGTYPSQSISGSKTGTGCSVVGESGTNIGVLSISANYFSLENVTVIAPNTHGSGGLSVSSDNVTLKNVYLHGPYVSVNISGVDNLLWQGGELGEAGKVGGKRVVCPAGGGSGDPEPVQISNTTNVTFDGIEFHPQDADLTPVPCSSNGFHLEMIRIEGGNDYFTLRNSTFDSGDNSGTASIFITTSSPGGSAADHLLFENNFFGDVDASSGAFSVHSNVTTCRNYTFAYNTIISSTGAFQCANMVNNKWIGNLGPNFFDAAKPCPAITSVMYTNNVWQDDYINYSGNKNCGTDGVTPGFGGTNPGADTLVQGTRYSTNALGLGGADGFHLQAGSKAIDKGERVGGYCTTTLGSKDHDGGSRPTPAGGRCDAGAHEYGSIVAPVDTLPPTVSITAPANSATVSGASVTVSASASDNVGVGGVQFKLDGVNLGSEDTAAPYSTTWNTTGATNGTHTLTAVARDTYGNITTSSAVTVTVSNTPTPKPGDTNGDNLVNIVDLSTLLSKWNTNFPAADFNTDGTVGIVDLSILLSNYGK